MKNDFTIKELSEKEFMPLFEESAKTVFGHDHSYRVRDLLDDTELEKMQALDQRMGTPYRLHLGVFDKNNKFVGWSWGIQESSSTFYMVNSGVLEECRRKGIYSALVKRCVETVSGNGFQLIYSRHCSTNNNVIIPKLKAGFVISKMEMDDRFGVLIHLHFYTNKDRLRIMHYRSGQLRPDQKLKQLFKL